MRIRSSPSSSGRSFTAAVAALWTASPHDRHVVLTRHVPAPTASSYRRTGRAQILALGPLCRPSLLRRQNFPFGTPETLSVAVCAIFARLRSVPAFPVASTFRTVGVHLLVVLRCVLAEAAEFLPRSHGEALGRRRGESSPPWPSGLLWAPRWWISAAESSRCGLSGNPSCLGSRIFLSLPREPSPALSARFSSCPLGGGPLPRHGAAVGVGCP